MMVIKIVYTVRDAKGKEATTEVKIPITISLTNAITFATAMAVLIDALMKGQIVNISIVVGVQLSGIVGIKTVPDADSDVEEKGAFGFITVEGFPTSVNIPTFDEAFVTAGSDVIDLADAAVIDFTEAMLLGLTAGVLVEPVDAHGDDIDLFSYGYERFQASGRRR
jgi:hypothetical protein